MDYPSHFKLKVSIEYEGTHFWGWQIQPNRETVQKAVEDAVTIFINAEFKKQGIDKKIDRIKVKASGRTDRGVHALQQVISFAWPEELNIDSLRMLRALNGISPKGVAFLDAQKVPSTFDAQYSAVSKHYRYRIAPRSAPLCLDDARAWRISATFDNKAIEACLELLIGTHDFSSFRASDCVARTTVRTIINAYLEIDRDGNLELNFIGTGFLKNMVRYTVAIIMEIALGNKSLTYISDLLQTNPRDPHIKLAPACGLFLVKVHYPYSLSL